MKRVAVSVAMIFFCIALALAHSVVQEQGRFSAAGLNDREVEAFFVSFKEAIATGDKKKVASLINYPIRVTLTSGRRKRIGRAADFIREYDRVFDAEFRRLIAKTEVKDLWAKSDGVAMPSGEIWFSGIALNPKRPETYRIKIIAINGAVRSSGR